jgi:hypothetical protein
MQALQRAHIMQALQRAHIMQALQRAYIMQAPLSLPSSAWLHICTPAPPPPTPHTNTLPRHSTAANTQRPQQAPTSAHTSTDPHITTPPPRRASVLPEQVPVSCEVRKQPCPPAKASCTASYSLQRSAAMQQLCLRCADAWSWDAASAQCAANTCPSGSSMLAASSEEGAVKVYYCGADGISGLTLQQSLTLAVCAA